MGNLKQIVYDAMTTYTVEGENGFSFLTQAADGNILTVVYISKVDGKTDVDTGLLVRIESETVIIEHDANNKPLLDMLIAAGIPREQIVLAYAGETLATL